MNAKEQTKHPRRLTGVFGVSPWGFAGERASCTPAHAAPQGNRPGEFSRIHQHQALAGSVCRPATRAAEPRNAPPAPIWLAALLATPCQAVANGEDRAIRWDCASGRAVYTNSSDEIEFIQPLGVQLRGGDSLAVSWLPGETAYTLEVYRQGSMTRIA